MGRVEGGQGQLQQPTPLGVQLHQQLDAAGAYERIQDPQKRQFLQTFLSTNKSMGDIARATNGEWSLAGVSKSLHISMRTVFPLLPPTTQTRFEGQAEKALQGVVADPVKEAARREKIKAGWQIEKPRNHTQNARKKPGEGRRARRKEAGDRAFSDSHRQQITNANLRRWQRYRAENAQEASTPDQ